MYAADISSPSAYLEVILGPMFSGKTSKLLEIYKQYEYCKISTLVINHQMDTRYHQTMLSTHNKEMIPCVQCDTLMGLPDTLTQEIDSCQAILINEGQFFPDLLCFVERMMANNKKVYVAGLDGDFKRNRFGQMLDLIPLCDKVVKLKSLCGKCRNGQVAIFSMRITEENTQTLIGSDNYMPVCRGCYDGNV